MIFDIHVHTEEYSRDSQLPLRSILSSAIKIGLSGVCITDHETQALYSQAGSLSKESGLIVIVGLEYSCQEGHLLVFGAPDLHRSQLPLNSALKEIKARGGIAIAAHPFRWDCPLMSDAIRDNVSLLDGVEAFNGGASAQENLLAYEFASENKLPVFGGSDAHHESRIGRFVTDFATPVKDEKDFIRAVTRARTIKKEFVSINALLHKGTDYVPAYMYEKRLHDRLSPPQVHSIKDVLSAPKDRFSV